MFPAHERVSVHEASTINHNRHGLLLCVRQRDAAVVSPHPPFRSSRNCRRGASFEYRTERFFAWTGLDILWDLTDGDIAFKEADAMAQSYVQGVENESLFKIWNRLLACETPVHFSEDPLRNLHTKTAQAACRHLHPQIQ